MWQFYLCNPFVTQSPHQGYSTLTHQGAILTVVDTPCFDHCHRTNPPPPDPSSSGGRGGRSRTHTSWRQILHTRHRSSESVLSAPPPGPDEQQQKCWLVLTESFIHRQVFTNTKVESVNQSPLRKPVILRWQAPVYGGKNILAFHVVLKKRLTTRNTVIYSIKKSSLVTK